MPRFWTTANSTNALKPSMPLRRSVNPAANQIRDPDGKPISTATAPRAAYFAQGRPSIHDKPVHGFAPCRSTAREAERVGLSINDDHSSMSGFFDLEQSTDRL
jgi:hypothetical protein